MEEPILNREDVDSVERETRRKYSGETEAGYNADTLSRRSVTGSKSYFDRLLEMRLNEARKYAKDARVLDVGCATGTHLLELADEILWGVGVDFSYPLVKRGMEARRAGDRVVFLEGNARCLPFQTESFDFVFSFSALYYMPNIEEVLGEIARVLLRGGRCLIELGNIYSLNSIVCEAYPELARSFHITIPRMKVVLRQARLRIVEHRAFQILPLWGDKPDWLGPLLHPNWRRLLERRVGSRMLDEWLCKLPGLRQLAFRHLFVCEKT